MSKLRFVAVVIVIVERQEIYQILLQIKLNQSIAERIKNAAKTLLSSIGREEGEIALTLSKQQERSKKKKEKEKNVRKGQLQVRRN